MPPQSVKPASEQTASAVSGDGAGSSLEEEKRQAIQKNLMGSSEEEVGDNLDNIDKADLDEFLMNKEEEIEVNKEEKTKPRKLAEGKRKRESDGTEDKVPSKKRRGQLQTMSGVEVEDGVAAGDNENGGGEVEDLLLNKEGEGRRGGGEESPDGRQSQPKSLSCEHCGKTFPYQSMLDKHMASHTKPFPCGFCTKPFSRKVYLKIHLSKYHSVKNVDLHRYVLFFYVLVFHFIIK